MPEQIVIKKKKNIMYHNVIYKIDATTNVAI